jgi:hypothetical protein
MTPEPIVLLDDNQRAAQEANRERPQATKARFTREKLTRESNLTTARKYRPCPDGCGLVLLWANRGYHPIPEDLEPVVAAASREKTPNTYPQAASQMQVQWARGELRSGGQHPPCRAPRRCGGSEKTCNGRAQAKSSHQGETSSVSL